MVGFRHSRKQGQNEREQEQETETERENASTAQESREITFFLLEAELNRLQIPQAIPFDQFTQSFTWSMGFALSP